jgi:hypothetical protein
MSPPTCPAAQSHSPLILPCVPKDQPLAPWSMALWEVLHISKEPMPPNQAPHTLEALGQPSNAPIESTLGLSGQLGTT